MFRADVCFVKFAQLDSNRSRHTLSLRELSAQPVRCVASRTLLCRWWSLSFRVSSGTLPPLGVSGQESPARCPTEGWSWRHPLQQLLSPTLAHTRDALCPCKEAHWQFRNLWFSPLPPFLVSAFCLSPLPLPLFAVALSPSPSHLVWVCVSQTHPPRLPLPPSLSLAKFEAKKLSRVSHNHPVTLFLSLAKF